MRKQVAVFIIFSSLLACKKDKLDGEKEILIGKWNWSYTIQSVNYNCDNYPPVVTILTPSTQGVEFSLEFNKKGCVTFYKNSKKIDKKRIVFTGWYLESPIYFPGYYRFGIWLNNKSENIFSGWVKSDTLIDQGYFPYREDDGLCISYTNYFVKE
jgi:hypothetical protein